MLLFSAGGSQPNLVWGGLSEWPQKGSTGENSLGVSFGSISKPMCDIKMGPQIGAIFINNSFNKGFSKKIKGPKKSVFLGQKLNKLVLIVVTRTDGFYKKQLFPAFLRPLIIARSAPKSHVCCIFKFFKTKYSSVVKKVIVVKWMGYKTQLFSATFPLSMIARSAPKKFYIWCILEKNSAKYSILVKKTTPNHQEYGKKFWKKHTSPWSQNAINW